MCQTLLGSVGKSKVKIARMVPRQVYVKYEAESTTVMDLQSNVLYAPFEKPY